MFAKRITVLMPSAVCAVCSRSYTDTAWRSTLPDTMTLEKAEDPCYYGYDNYKIKDAPTQQAFEDTLLAAGWKRITLGPAKYFICADCKDTEVKID